VRLVRVAAAVFRKEASLLAYVFWHCRRERIGTADYERALLDFHRTLDAHRPPGFLGARVLKLPRAEWLVTERGVYEEWYLVEGSEVLDLLDRGAVSPPCGEPHDAVARHAAAGTAGLYRLREGELENGPVATACWLAKPPRQPYPDFFEELRPWTSLPGAALWGRQMVLGPTPEFCLHLSPGAPDPPSANVVHRHSPRLLWEA
jgi:hypothetical protein